MLTALLEYIDLFNLSDSIKQVFGRGCLPFTISVYFNYISKAIIAKQVHFAQIFSYYSSILLVAFVFLLAMPIILPAKSTHP